MKLLKAFSDSPIFVKTKLLFLAAILLPFQLLAQEGGLDVNVDIGAGESSLWYESPWVWVGVAAFIIILVLAMKTTKKA